ncbi:MAG: iron-containing alcohol dehydrogenase, partial [Blautia sp.]|nr:iron-containing alcohol dehydrogenase [Blautia sp.]
VLDPEVTRSLPASLTATTGMDALTHAVEAYIGRSTTKETREEAREAVRLIFSHVERAYRNGNDLEARKAMLQAAFLAGDAFSKSYVGYVHAIAHALGGCYNIPHGLANAVLLPIVLDGYGECAAAKLHELAVVAGVSTAEESDSLAAEKFIVAIRGLNARMGIPSTLRGIKEEDIHRLSQYADAEANPLYPVPCLWNASQLERFFYLVMEEKKEIRVGQVALVT